jgi:hypothetical protein
MKHSEVITRLLPRTATTDASELGTELAWCAILLSTVLSPTVVLTIPTGSAIGSLTATAGATCPRLGRASTNGFAMCLWDDFCRKVEPFTEIFEPFRCKCVIVPLPRKPRLDVTTGGK